MNRRKGNRAEINEAQRRQFVNSRLQALEDDGNALELDNSDDEFHIEDVLDEVEDEEVDVGVTAALKNKSKKKPKKKKVGKRVVPGKRKTRGMEKRGPKPFMQLLEEAELDRVPEHVPTYFNTAARPSRYPPKKLCDVSGFFARYKDPASKMRYAGRREYNVIQSMPTAALHAHLRG
ncbi:YL1_C domain-containing protein [Chloropicon roscoffensis]|uniref:YL1_C domain-containing protein n=2 Tax=Chloropicon roscoffensis TaxID=1461544 RepID=A0AAX4P117_9CHLO